jgi:hypothetical protein
MDGSGKKEEVILHAFPFGDIDENGVCKIGQKFYLHIGLTDSGNIQYETDYVDVMVICSLAEVTPPRKRLSLPPKPRDVVEFSVRPESTGDIMVTILLLIKGECIHKSEFYFTCE